MKLLITRYNCASTTFRAQFSPIVFEKRQKTKQLTPKQFKLINSTKGKRKNGVNCPFKQDLQSKAIPVVL